MVATNADLTAALANILMPKSTDNLQAPNINIPARLPAPTLNIPSANFKAAPNGTGGITAAIAALNALGNAANASKQNVSFDPSGFNAIDNVAQNIAARNNAMANAKPVNISLPAPAQSQSSGNSDWLGTLLNDTIEQPAGFFRTAFDNTLNDVKGDLNSNAPWWQKGLNVINDTVGLKGASDAAWNGLKSGASQQLKDWKDGSLSWNDLGGGFFGGMVNSWASGEKVNQDTGLNSVLDKHFTNSNLQTGILGGWNKMLASMDGTWVNKIPLLGQLPTASKQILQLDPKGHQGIDQVAGMGTEILSDPLTYLDGAGIATKAGKAAELGKMKDIASTLGLEGKFKDTTSFEAALTNKLKSEASSMQIASQTNRAKELAQSMGIDASRISHPADLITEAQQMIGQKYPHLPSVTAGTIDNLAKELDTTGNIYGRLAEKQIADHMNSVNAARADAANKALNTWGFSAPFTNKAIAVGKVPDKFLGIIKNPLFHSEAQLGDANVHIVNNLISDIAKNDAGKASQLENTIKQYYGVNDLKDLTKTQYSHLVENAAPMLQDTRKGIPDTTVTQKVVNKWLPKDQFYKQLDEVKAGHVPWKDVQNQLESIINKVGDHPTKRASFGAIAAKMVSDYWKNAPTKNFSKVANARKAEAMNWVSNWLHQSDKVPTVKTKLDKLYPKGKPEFHTDMTTANNTVKFNKFIDKLSNSKYTKVNNAQTRLDHFFEGKNPFNARTLGTGDKFTNSLANHISDANSAKVGLKAQHGSDMSNIEKYIKKNNITSQEMTDTIYHLEDQAPKSYAKDWQPSDRVQQLASLVKPILDRIGNQEKNAGTLNQLRENYFPHVVNKEMDMQKFDEFKQRHPDLFGVNQNSKFNQSRTSFQTMADAKDHLDALGQKMAQTTDPKELADLQDHFDKVRNLFDQNIPSALHERIRAGANAIANKDMQANFKKFGALVINPKDTSRIGTNMEKLDKETSRKLGLNPEDQNYMHPDVLKGLKRIDDIFTAEGMNKFVRNVNAITDIFRAGVTTFKFSHYRNNIIGNVINNMAAGVKPSEYVQAGKMLQRLRAGKLTAGDQAIIYSAYKHNVINGGFVTDMLHGGGLTFKDPTSLEKVAKLVSNNKVAKGMRGKMEQIDDVARLGNYINGLKKFGDAEKAAKQVRTYLFNYNEMTNMDRTMRMMIPFWNWTKRNIPLQMKNILERPAIAVNFEKTKDQFNNGQDGADWQKDSGIKLPFLDYYTTLPSPTDDLKQLGNPLGLISSLNPVAKMGIEMAANKNLYTGKPISYGEQKIQAKDIPAYVAKNFGVAGDIGSLVGSMFGQGNKTPTEILTNYLNPESKINRGRGTVQGN